MNNLWGEIKNFFRDSNALSRLILINASIYLAFVIIHLVEYLFQLDQLSFYIISKAGLPANLKNLLYQPWSLFTYMFIHQEFFHIFFNMLWLYWMGTLFMEYLGGKKLTTLYILGGLAGGLVYLLAFNLFPVFSRLIPQSYTIGASAGIMAIIVGIATLIPDFRINILFFGPVRLKLIAIFYVILDIAGISESNAGGHFAHLGGALCGFIYVTQIKKGSAMPETLERLFSKISSLFQRRKLKVYHHAGRNRRPINDDDYALMKKEKQEIIDGILDKISQYGYNSLSKKEKELLFKMSKDDK